MIQKPYRNPAIPIVTILVTILALLASFGGLLFPSLYKDSVTIKQTWFANDLVTIPFAILLPITLLLQKRGDERPILVWTGLMFYMCYNYAFYLFGAKFNAFLLLYVGLFGLSLYSIVAGLLNINIYAIREATAYRKRQLFISAFLFLLAIPLFIIQIKRCLTFILSGEIPEMSTLIFVLDFFTVLPATILASILLWRNKPWGNILAMMVLVKSFAYGAVMMTEALIMNSARTTSVDPLLPFYIFLILGGFIFGWLHLKDMQPSRSIKNKTL